MMPCSCAASANRSASPKRSPIAGRLGRRWRSRPRSRRRPRARSTAAAAGSRARRSRARSRSSSRCARPSQPLARPISPRRTRFMPDPERAAHGAQRARRASRYAWWARSSAPRTRRRGRACRPRWPAARGPRPPARSGGARQRLVGTPSTLAARTRRGPVRADRRQAPPTSLAPMDPQRVLVALGGNAIAGERGAGPDAQRQAVEEAAAEIAELVAAGHQVVLTHGNGPQVGNLLVKNDLARDVVPPVPLDWCVAQTQATLGFLIVTALEAELRAAGPRAARQHGDHARAGRAADDPAWQRPTKPIGRWLSEAEARERIAAGETLGGRAASAAGGASCRRPSRWRSSTRRRSDALVGDGRDRGRRRRRRDPDGARGRDAARASRRCSTRTSPARCSRSAVDADCFVIATDVEAAAIRFGTPEQEWLRRRQRRSGCARSSARGTSPAAAWARRWTRRCAFVEGGGRQAAITSLDARARGRRGHGRDDRARVHGRARDRAPRRLPRLGDADARLARGRGRGGRRDGVGRRWRRRSTSS